MRTCNPSFQTILLLLTLAFLGESSCTHAQTHTNPSFQQQLDTFSQLGFVLNPGIDTSEVNRWGGLKTFEEGAPWSLMYITLGEYTEKGPTKPLTNKCWHLDMEYIEGEGSYVDIIENLNRIAGSELVFEDIKDYVAFDEGTAWVSFTLNGDPYTIDLQIDDDWIDPDLFNNLIRLTASYPTQGKYTYYDTGGQDLVIGFETPESLAKLKAATGLEIEWLTAAP